MTILLLAWKSLWNRRLAAGLLLLSIALSSALLLGVERLRVQARESFTRSLSGTDLVVGARSGPVALMLYAVFRIGDATNNIAWRSHQRIAADPRVAWTVPLSLGDSHRGYRVLGTNAAYFERYRTGDDRPLALAAGARFADVFEAVLGHEVADRLGYRLGQTIVLAHGAGEVSFVEHDDRPFRVVGILAPTGTPVDRTIHVPLEGIEALHVDWEGGAPPPGRTRSSEQVRGLDLTPKTITAILVGLKSRVATFAVQRAINELPDEPLLAVIPGLALEQLWDIVGVAENALRLVAAGVLATSLAGLVALALAVLDARRREIAILRALGARPVQVFALVVGESAIVTLAGATLGLVLLQGGVALLADWILGRFGLVLDTGWPSPTEALMLAAVVASGAAAGFVPGWRAYRLSLSEGMRLRL
ncbi:MAG: ABC transporter permease [Alphaproteobacteria bacterium]|nr:ABC transporter permease [Alphaproteobacteria bacterium]